MTTTTGNGPSRASRALAATLHFAFGLATMRWSAARYFEITQLAMRFGFMPSQMPSLADWLRHRLEEARDAQRQAALAAHLEAEREAAHARELQLRDDEIKRSHETLITCTDGLRLATAKINELTERLVELPPLRLFHSEMRASLQALGWNPHALDSFEWLTAKLGAPVCPKLAHALGQVDAWTAPETRAQRRRETQAEHEQCATCVQLREAPSATRLLALCGAYGFDPANDKRISEWIELQLAELDSHRASRLQTISPAGAPS